MSTLFKARLKRQRKAYQAGAINRKELVMAIVDYIIEKKRRFPTIHNHRAFFGPPIPPMRIVGELYV